MERIEPNFDFEGIGIAEIQAEAEQILKHELKSGNPFPFEVFPEAIQQIILETNKNLDFPIDFIGAGILYAASVCIGNSFRIEVKKGWLESSVLYLAIVARAGTNKSHPLSFALQPIFEQDKKALKKYERELQEYNQTVNLPKAEREKQGIEEPVKPHWKKFLVSDCTPEALAEVHKFNQRGIGEYSDELAGWVKNFNRYNKGSEQEFWLSAWNSKPITIDRVSKEPVFIPLPFISVAGTIQNGVLNELAKENRTENGFIDRILFVIPENIKKPYWGETELNPVIIDNWNAIVTSLINLPVKLDITETPLPEILRFSPEAKRLLWEWQKKNADECNQAESEAISGIFSKLEMYAVRLALILELLRWACNESSKQAVSIEAVQGALKLVEYFKQSAIKVYSIITNTNPLNNLPADKRNLYEALPDLFTTSEGFKVAEGFGMAERTYKYFLNDKELFLRISTGKYEKRF